MMEIFNFIVNEGPTILFGALAAIGGLKVLARYTPFKWDDKGLEFAEKWTKWAADKLPKPKSKEEPKE